MKSEMSVRKLVSYIIVLYCGLLPLEWLLFSFFGAGAGVIQLVRLTFDLLPTTLLIGLILINQVKFSQFTLLLLAVYFVSLLLLFIGNVIHDGRISTMPGHFGVTFRFVPLAIIIGDLSSKVWTFDNLRSISRYYLYAFLAIGLVEIVTELEVRKLLLPSEQTFSQLSDELPVSFRIDRYYSVSAMYPTPIDFAFVVIGLMIIYLSNLDDRFRLRNIGLICASILVTYYTRSMAALLFLLLVVYLKYNDNKFLRYFGYFLGVVVIVTLVSLNFNQLVGYFENSLTFSRLGIIMKTLPAFLTSNLEDVIFGLGSDVKIVYEIITHYPAVPKMLFYDWGFSSFKDVYWVAMIVQNGTITVLLFGLIVSLVYKYSIGLNVSDRVLLRQLVIMVFVLGFVNQILDIKPFSLLLWVTIGIFDNHYRMRNVHSEIT